MLLTASSSNRTGTFKTEQIGPLRPAALPEPATTGIELRHLRYFVAVAEKLHFGRAAKALHISQPPLSRQIRDLEMVLGVPLLDRGAKSVALTEAGMAFLDEARGILQSVSRSIQIAQRAAAGEMRHLSIGVSALIDPGLVERLKQAFAARCPEVELVPQHVSSDAQTALLRTGTLDVGLLLLPVADAGGLSIEPLHREPAVVLLSGSHPLANEAGVTVETLSEYPVTTLRQAGSADHVARLGAMCGVPLASCRPCSTPEDLWRTVLDGYTVAVVPAGARSLTASGLRTVPLLDPAADFTFGLAYHAARLNPTLARFVQAARMIRPN